MDGPEEAVRLASESDGVCLPPESSVPCFLNSPNIQLFERCCTVLTGDESSACALGFWSGCALLQELTLRGPLGVQYVLEFFGYSRREICRRGLFDLVFRQYV